MPETIGKYTIASQLGRGGMGVVYKAYDESLRRFVAIKVLSENLTDDETFLQRFVREAQAAAGVTHPNIVQIYFIGEHEGKPYFVMEYVTGKSLAGLLREEDRIPNPRSAQMILQAAHGLAAAHDQGIIHRDIKPGNLMLDERGIVKIADFGLALPVAAEKRLTATGMLVGTPGYLAPEQCRGETVDHRTDIYALGVTYYELLSGTSPFQGESPFALMRKILEEEPPDIAVLFPDVDAETLRIVSKMLAKDRDQRYQNCHELATDLEELLAKSGVRSATAGLATRVPTAAQRASAAAAANVATQVTAPMLVSQSEASSIEGAAVPPAPTERVAVPAAQNVEPKTQPEVSFAEPPTVVQALAPAAPQRSRLPLVLIVIAVLVGASLIAAYAAMTLYRGWQARQQGVAAVSQPEPLAASSATTTSTSAALLLSAPNAAVGSQITGNAPATATPKGAAAAVQPGTAPAVAAPTGRAPTVVPVPTAVPGAQIATPRESAPPATVRPALAAPSARPDPPLSGVAVVVTGDAALTGPVASVLTEELGAAGLAGVVDAASHPSLEDVSRDSSTARLLARVRDEGIATVVVARIQATGQRELSYMRRQDTAYNARLTLTSYDTATGRMIGAPASAQIEYTARTAEREAESVVGPLARACARIIQGREQP